MMCDCCGYATKSDLRCSDGRIIRKNAFEDDDGAKVPLVWNHQRNSPENVLGHAILENRSDGVYAYCIFNDTELGNVAKSLVAHKDIDSLSIYANNLVQNGPYVTHGSIKEVSLVLAGANPGARIENVTIEHSDGSMDSLDDEAIIWSMGSIEHADEKSDDENQNGSDTSNSTKADSEDGKTAKEIFDSMNEEQKKLVYAMLGYALGDDDSDGEEDDKDEKTDENDMKHSDEGGDNIMHKNVFEGSDDKNKGNTLSHSEIVAIFDDAKKYGSLKTSALEHGVESLDILFPEAKSVTPTPDMIMRDQTWVSKVFNAARKTPFSRVKSITADITKDEARARGYIKGKKKLDEEFSLLKRVTTPQTIYKKQSLDRDDITDITDFDFVAWMKAEMRLMLIEEAARAMLIGDGRVAGDESKINETNIRPIYLDDDMYSIHYNVAIPENATREEKSDAIVDGANLARIDYKGSGSPTMFCSSKTLTEMLLAKDKIGHRLYANVSELATALRVKEIIEVPVMDEVTREDGGKTYGLLAIIVNMNDYVIGADKGGAVTMFDDFDIDYNKEKYLIETRMSGALVKPYSAIVLETETTAAAG